MCDLVVLYGGWFWGEKEYSGVIGFLDSIWGECVVVAILLDFYCIQVGCYEGVVLNGIIVRGVDYKALGVVLEIVVIDGACVGIEETDGVDIFV